MSLLDTIFDEVISYKKDSSLFASNISISQIAKAINYQNDKYTTKSLESTTTNLDRFNNQTKSTLKNFFLNFSDDKFEKKLFCLKNYPFPKNYDPTNVHFKLKKISNENSTCLSGSYVQFSCLNGYFLSSHNMNLTTYCRDNSTWSDVGDCKHSSLLKY